MIIPEALYLNYNAKKAMAKGITIGIVTILAYIGVVIVTTPGLPPSLAVKAAFAINSIVIFGTAAGVGVQFFISNYSKGLGYCKLLDKKPNRAIFGAATAAGYGTSTAISSFLSFFSLVPLGCCGSWILILSFLPSIIGSSLSVALIQYSKPISYTGLAILFGYTTLSTFKLKRELKQMKKSISNN